MATNNAINLSAAGLAKYDGVGGFTGVTVTQHDLLIGAASNGITSVAPSATVGVPVVSAGTGSDPVFGTAVVAGGGTGLATLTAYELLAAGTTSTGSLQQIALGTTGQVLTSNGAGALASYQTFSSQPAYVNVTGATQAMAANTGYVTNDSGSLITYTPPATCAVGSVFAIVGNSSAGWSINLTTNTQTINYGSSPATTALASSNQYDGVKFVCTVANTTFSVVSSQGNLTVS